MKYLDAYRSGKTWIVAEIGNIHDGSLGECFCLMEAARAQGAHAVKFQCHIADAESTEREQFPRRFRFHPQDKTRQDYWRRIEFTQSQWVDLANAAHNLGLEFIISPFSVEAVNRMSQLANRWKIASGEVNNAPLLAAVAATDISVILSSGMSSDNELDAAVHDLCVRENGLKPKDYLTVLQCTTEYPTDFRHVGLNKVFEWSRNICFWGGLSDHSGTIYPGVIAAYLGAALVEVHVCWSKLQFGVDASSSLTMEQFREMCDGIEAANAMRTHPIDKTQILKELTDYSVYRDGKRREAFQ